MKRYIIFLVCLSCMAFYGSMLSAAKSDTTIAATHAAGNNDVLGGNVLPKSDAKLTIFPNPVTDVVRVDGLEGAYSVKIIDALGQVVISAEGTSAGVELNMSGKPEGMYLIRVESQGKITIRKLIKK